MSNIVRTLLLIFVLFGSAVRSSDARMDPVVTKRPRFTDASWLTDLEEIWGDAFFTWTHAPPLKKTLADTPRARALETVTGGEDEHYVVGLQWNDRIHGKSRALETSFMVPTERDFTGWTHVGHMVAFEAPDTDDPESGYGRFGSAVYRDVLYVEYMMFSEVGCPEMGSSNLFAGKLIPGGLQPGHWYHIRSSGYVSAGGIRVRSVLYEISSKGGRHPLVWTSERFPPECYPPWYATDKTKFLVGIQGDRQGVRTIIDDLAMKSR